MLEILYQDEHLVAINKPSGLLVHKSPIDKKEKLFAIQLLRDQLGKRVYPIHRLDKPTSGVLLFAFDKETLSLLSQAFQEHTIQKEYIALVRGWIDEKGLIDHALSQKLDKIADKGKVAGEPQEALTEYKRIEKIELAVHVDRYPTSRYSLVKLRPKTGRKHQLRRHMKHLSHHIIGDTKYGRGEHNKMFREKFDIHRLMLMATSLTFIHPYTNESITCKANLDKEFSFFNKFVQN
jgi:tRNA pseudouridine65 synthase